MRIPRFYESSAIRLRTLGVTLYFPVKKLRHDSQSSHARAIAGLSAGTYTIRTPRTVPLSNVFALTSSPTLPKFWHSTSYNRCSTVFSDQVRPQRLEEHTQRQLQASALLYPHTPYIDPRLPSVRQSHDYFVLHVHTIQVVRAVTAKVR